MLVFSLASTRQNTFDQRMIKVYASKKIHALTADSSAIPQWLKPFI